VIALLFFFSGALALGYQTLWARQLLDSIGVSAWSYAVVLAAFMGGLALGGALLGPLADRSPRPLRFYAVLEAGLGAYALAFPWIASGMDRLFGWWVSAGGYAGGADALLAKALLSGLALLPPTLLMGGTYPALLRQATPRLELLGRSASWLYAVNAAGAVVGALGLPFAAIPLLGMRRSLLLLALGNALLAAVALVLASRTGPAVAGAPEPSPAGEARASRALFLFVLVEGFAAFLLETGWIRYFSLVLGSSTYSLAVMLAAFIAGIALGSALLARFDARLRNAFGALAATQAAAGLLVLAPLGLYPYGSWLLSNWGSLFSTEPAAFPLYEAGKLVVAFLVMLGPTLFIGMAVPLAVRAACGRLASVGRDTGRIYAFNTAGNVAGALLAGLVLLPAFGSEKLLRLAGALHLALGAAVFLALRRSGRFRALAAGLLAAGVALAVALPGAWDERFFSLNPARRELAWRSLAQVRDALAPRRIELLRDDPAAQVIVWSNKAPDGSTQKTLAVNAKTDASTGFDMPTQVLSGHVPMLLNPAARRVLVIGLASGVTCGSVLTHPVEALDVVDIVGSMPAAARLFSEWNHGALDDPRLRFVADDARSFLVHSGRRYDVIISEPSNPWMAGTGALFSRDFYRQAARALAPGGVYLQWLQNYETGDATFSAIVRSFRLEFPVVHAFQATQGDVLLAGTLAPLPRPAGDVSAPEAPAVTSDLRRLGIEGLRSVLAFQLLSPPAVDYLASTTATVNDDDNHFVEHRAPLELFAKRSSRVALGLDERLRASPSLLARQAGLDARAVAQALSDRRVRIEPVASGIETAARWSAEPDATGAGSEGALVGTVEGLLAAAQLEGAAAALEAQHPAILWTVASSAAGAARWSARLDGWLARAGAAAPPKLRALRIEASMAEGRLDAARDAIEAWGRETPGPPAEWAVLRACEIDPGAACDAAIAAGIERGGGETLERLERLRAGPP